jgi:hypothetical protein
VRSEDEQFLDVPFELHLVADAKRITLIRGLLWPIRKLKFHLVIDEFLTTYDWRIVDGKVVDYFESPNGSARGGVDGYYICCVLRKEGFLRLTWLILTRSRLVSGPWRRTFNQYRETGYEWPWFESCDCPVEITRFKR